MKISVKECEFLLDSIKLDHGLVQVEQLSYRVARLLDASLVYPSCNVFCTREFWLIVRELKTSL